jgi:hypothetical protein
MRGSWYDKVFDRPIDWFFRGDMNFGGKLISLKVLG